MQENKQKLKLLNCIKWTRIILPIIRINSRIKLNEFYETEHIFKIIRDSIFSAHGNIKTKQIRCLWQLKGFLEIWILLRKTTVCLACHAFDSFPSIKWTSHEIMKSPHNALLLLTWSHFHKSGMPFFHLRSISADGSILKFKLITRTFLTPEIRKCTQPKH